ncbi:YqgE/AlgH family protein [Actibacterium sp. 188UL27-1]|uniref:YqgE/AlgH family protein n=1 Tax=Actibacterium sp. 188UL27-1 TaxID=2786961 RepID=UPI00195ACB6C|nr:YqgE/AlgH family protein [Actibacterium sp. 188UL27-1]MBM7068519.1 YqgE/AlgH family protein [Actibacterium sp. 188UL27-1]
MELTGQFLVAMPGMGDARFEKSVILLCAHSRDSTLGLVINQPAVDLSFDDLLQQIEITSVKERPGDLAKTPIHIGGPVEHGRGFVLHSSDYTQNESTLTVGKDFGMTATRDVLEDIANGRGPKKRILCLGYAGWGAGQLEDEIGRNGWLTTEANPDIVFEAPNNTKWEAALATLGVDPLTLSAAAGRA